MYLLTLNTFRGQPKQPLRSLKAIANFKKAMKRKLWKRITVFSSKKGCVIILENLSFSVVSIGPKPKTLLDDRQVCLNLVTERSEGGHVFL